MNESINSIFKHNSKTYYYSTLFFPNSVKGDVFTLYAFVRTADDFIDQAIPQKAEYFKFKSAYKQTLKGKPAANEIISQFANVVKKRQIDPKWVEAFFSSMEMDLSGTIYPDMQTTLKYIYGSAEVVGLMMAKILDLPKEAFPSAQKLGRAMQYINIIRDIDEDRQLKRSYFPRNILDRYHLTSLDDAVILNKQNSFERFVRDQIRLYRQWQHQAELGYRYIPRRFLIPIKTAADMYQWTAKIIDNEPMIVFRKKVKPNRVQVLLRAILNSIYLGS